MRNLKEPPLFLQPDLIHGATSIFIYPLLLIQLYRILQQELRHRFTLRDLMIGQQSPQESAQADSLVLPPKRNWLLARTVVHGCT